MCVGTANAATSVVSCNKLTYNKTTHAGTVTGCTGQTGSSGTLANFTPNGGTVHWKNKTTSTYTTSASDEGPGTCPSKTAKFVLQGKVTKSTNKSAPKGSTVSMTLCDPNGSTGNITNATGTKVKI
ncbi:MAG TPA: hypothetical protein VGO03_13760 [Acidimicrobiia bacterium]|jgi:hypothetical protein